MEENVVYSAEVETKLLSLKRLQQGEINFF